VVAGAVLALDKQDIDTAEEPHLQGAEMDSKMEAAATYLQLLLPGLILVGMVDWENGILLDSADAVVVEWDNVQGEV
jgi:hypothetical protein